jgi:cytoskeletal protein CcmA (bactofilin family)
MWSAKKPDTKSTDTMSPLDGAAVHESGWLGSSLRVKGDITGTEDLLIDGWVEGFIELDGRKLTVGAAAKVTADINARDVVVHGYVKGNIRAKGRVEIKKDGSVVGNLTTAQIMIEDGADFKGSIEIDRGTPEEADKNVSSRTAAAGAGPRSI